MRATIGRQVAYSSDLGRLLGLDDNRSGEHGSQASDEGTAIHLFKDLIRP